MSEHVNEALAKKVLEVIDAGLVSGMGKPVPGQMCVEAAVCYAMGLPHSDRPTCVAPSLRRLKIKLNDSSWSTNAARTDGLRRLGIAQLGSAGTLDEVTFAKKVSVLVIQKYVQIALRAAAKTNPSKAASLEEAATLCSLDPSIENAKKAQTTAYAVAVAAADAAARGVTRDKILADFCEDVVQILIEMNAPGTAYLYLTEGK